jgi:hypothetical protein
LEYGADAEFLVVAILPLALGVQTTVKVLDAADKDGKFLAREGTYGANGPELTLLLKNQHYNILYAK